MEGSFTTSIPVADLAPSQRQHLDDDLRREGIPVTWFGDRVQFDHAFEARIETLVAEARTTPAGPAPEGSAHAAAPQPAPPPVYAAPALYPPPAYPPAYPAPVYGAGYPYRPQVTNSNATISLVLGIVGWAVCPIASIFGVIYARRAQQEIAASGGLQGGEGLAKAGLIISWIVIAIYGLMIAFGLLFVLFAVIFGAAASVS